MPKIYFNCESDLSKSSKKAGLKSEYFVRTGSHILSMRHISICLALGMLACSLPRPAAAFLPSPMSLLTASLQPALRVASVLAVDYAPLSSAGRISLDIFGSLFGVSPRGRKIIRLRPPKYTEMALAVMQKLSGTAERFKQQYVDA